MARQRIFTARSISRRLIAFPLPGQAVFLFKRLEKGSLGNQRHRSHSDRHLGIPPPHGVAIPASLCRLFPANEDVRVCLPASSLAGRAPRLRSHGEGEDHDRNYCSVAHIATETSVTAETTTSWKQRTKSPGWVLTALRTGQVNWPVKCWSQRSQWSQPLFLR